jgi:glycosyltransferase involved in cell wall biosynthesis
MKFSIILPVYNCEKYLKRCIDSVINQTYSDWELILVDDGSTDLSGDICDDYSSMLPGQIRVIHQENSGVLFARRVGIVSSFGEYLCFIDSDDWYGLNLLEVAKNFENSFHPDLLVYGYKKISEQGQLLEIQLPVEEITYISGARMKSVYERITSGQLSNLWAQIVKRSCVDFEADYCDYVGVFKGEDLLQNLAFVDNAKSVLLIPECMYSYLINQTGLTHRKITLDYINSHIIVQKTMLGYCEKWKLDPNPTSQLFMNVFVRCLKALSHDSFFHPKYSLFERKQLLEYLSSGLCFNYLERFTIQKKQKYGICIWLLKHRKLMGLSAVLYFFHILLIMKNAWREASRCLRCSGV